MSTKRISVGITGQKGFLGSHLQNFLQIQKDIKLINFKKHYFNNINKLSNFTNKCDYIVHLAALNRHENQNFIYDTNIELTEKLIKACRLNKFKKHIIFSSSIQHKNLSQYGKSKNKCSEILKSWSNENHGYFTNLVIPNIFGPFGKPFYNSFVSTFCYQLINGAEPNIDKNNKIKLIYVGTLVEKIYKIIQKNNFKKENGINCSEIELNYDKNEYVSVILKLLKSYDTLYRNEMIIPSIETQFELNLFNTYRSFLPTNYFPKIYTQHTDKRGSFTELVRSNNHGQFSFSITKPGIIRGQHFHTRKVERFMVVDGKAEIKLRKIGTNDIIVYHFDGNKPQYVDIPIWHTHYIKNIGKKDLVTLFWVNEHYDEKNPDTYFEEV